jgi:hypothetical protein
MKLFNFPKGLYAHGDTFIAFPVRIKDSMGGGVDITGAEIFMQIKQGTKTGLTVKDLSLGSGITMVNAVEGRFLIDQFQITFRGDIDYYYDIRVIISGVTHTLIGGIIPLFDPVTVIS